jgi:hypothetical protein
MTVRSAPSGSELRQAAFLSGRRRDVVEGLGRCRVLDIRRRAANQAQVQVCGTSATVRSPTPWSPIHPLEVLHTIVVSEDGAVDWTNECAW